MDVNNFENFSKEEYEENLKRLGIEKHSDLVGKPVYYSIIRYGKHVVVEWDADRAHYLLDLDGDRFWSNPFRILL